MVIMSTIKMDKNEKAIFSISFLSFLTSLLLVRMSGFSSSSMVNLENYIVRSLTLQTSTNTFSTVYTFLSPFNMIFLALVFFVLGISILSYYGYKKNNEDLGKLLGIVSAVFTLILFPTIMGVFIAISIIFCCIYSPKLSSMYSKELEKWVFFRTGSNTTGKILFIVNIIILIGVFVTVSANQQAYEASFSQDITESMRAIALRLPGASSIPSQTLDERLASAVQSSPLINSYIVWLPVTTAFTIWVILEFLRIILLANIGGIFTYIMLKRGNRHHE